jgi:hypothetical protein
VAPSKQGDGVYPAASGSPCLWIRAATCIEYRALDPRIAVPPATFIHDPGINPDDGLAGAVIGKGRRRPQPVDGGLYAPYLAERWTATHLRPGGDGEVEL